jgi:hypothetical protein
VRHLIKCAAVRAFEVTAVHDCANNTRLAVGQRYTCSPHDASAAYPRSSYDHGLGCVKAQWRGEHVAAYRVLGPACPNDRTFSTRISSFEMCRAQSSRPLPRRWRVHAPELAVESHLQILRRHRRTLLLCLEHPDQSAVEDHVHRKPRLGSRRSLIVRIGIRHLQSRRPNRL